MPARAQDRDDTSDQMTIVEPTIRMPAWRSVSPKKRRRAGLLHQSTGTATYAGVFAAWCNLREAIPYAFGYNDGRQGGTGIVAELGAMRISEEIDALQVMGIDSVTFLCATRLLAAWIVLPFMYVGAIGVAYLASYLAVVQQLGFVSSGGYLLISGSSRMLRTSSSA